jgi:O-antigen ligase
MSVAMPMGGRTHPRLVTAGLALLAIAVGCAAVLSPVLAFFGVVGLAALMFALRDPSVLILGTLLAGMIGEPWNIAYASVSIGGLNLFPADVLIGLLLAGWLLATLRAGDVPAVARRRSDIVLLALLAYGLFSLVRSWSMHGSAALSGFRMQYVYGLIYFLATWSLRARDARRRLLIGILAAALVISLLGVFNAATGRHAGSATSTLTYRYLSGLQALAIFFGLALLAGYVWNRARPLWSLVLGAAYLTGILLSQARSVWLGGVLGLLVALGGASSRSRTRLLRYAPLIAIVLVLAVGAVVILNLGTATDLATRAASLTDVSEDVSAMWRLFVWGEALQELKSQPVLGLGLGQQFTYYDLVNDEQESRAQLHNCYLERAYYGGAISVGLLIAFQVLVLLFTLRAARRANGTPREGGLLALVCCQVTLAAVTFTNVISASMVSTLYAWVLSAVSVLEAEQATAAVDEQATAGINAGAGRE